MDTVKVKQSYYETDTYEFFKQLYREGIQQVVINIREDCKTCHIIDDFNNRVTDQIFYAKLFNFKLFIHRFMTFKGYSPDDRTEIIVDNVVFLNCGHAVI